MCCTRRSRAWTLERPVRNVQWSFVDRSKKANSIDAWKIDKRTRKINEPSISSRHRLKTLLYSTVIDTYLHTHTHTHTCYIYIYIYIRIVIDNLRFQTNAARRFTAIRNRSTWDGRRSRGGDRYANRHVTLPVLIIIEVPLVAASDQSMYLAEG